MELFDELTAAAADYDCSVGYNDRPGFRTGASFPYAPYDFRSERPFPLLEIPTAIMDATLFPLHGFDVSGARSRCARILHRASLYPGGGVSIIWHNTGFGGVQLPREYGDVYWQLRDSSAVWISGQTAARLVWPRFVAAGLLPHRM